MRQIYLFSSVTVIVASTVFGIFYAATPKAKIPVHQIVSISLLVSKANPDIVVVHTGDSIQFNSKDGKNHDLEQGHGNGYGDHHDHEVGAGSGLFKADEAYLVQFKKVGIYDFHDHLNPAIHITVIAK